MDTTPFTIAPASIIISCNSFSFVVIDDNDDDNEAEEDDCGTTIDGGFNDFVSGDPSSIDGGFNVDNKNDGGGECNDGL